MKVGFRPSLPGLRRLGGRIEDALLIALLTSMIVLAGLQIFMRNLLDTGFVWADELLRIKVLWLAMLGAVVASRDDNHINIDVLTRFLPERPRLLVRVVVDLATSVVCALVAWHGVRFVHLESQFGTTVLGQLPAWAFQAIIPVGFALIAYRYALLFFDHVRKVFFSGGAR